MLQHLGRRFLVQVPRLAHGRLLFGEKITALGLIQHDPVLDRVRAPPHRASLTQGRLDGRPFVALCVRVRAVRCRINESAAAFGATDCAAGLIRGLPSFTFSFSMVRSSISVSFSTLLATATCWLSIVRPSGSRM